MEVFTTENENRGNEKVSKRKERRSLCLLLDLNALC